MEKFEYIIKEYNGKTLKEISLDINKLGSEGWEIINISNLSNISSTIYNNVIFVFKRRQYKASIKNIVKDIK